MDFGMEAGIFLAYTAGLMLVYFFGRWFLVPLKFLGRAMISSMIGGAALLVVNVLGTGIGISLPLNIMTAAITGLLGAPGFLMLLAYFQFFA